MKSNGKRILAVLLCLVMLLGMLPATTVLAADAPIKVACVGDSITYGHNPASPSGTPRILDDNWTTLLGEELGDGYEVQNFGISGTTVMKAGDRPYWNEGAFTQSKNYQPDIVILMLGTNDSKPSNWGKKDQFDDDLKALIEAYQSLDSKPKVYVATSATAYNDGAFSIVPSVVSDEIVPIQKQVAKEMGCRVIDIHAATADMAANFPDNIHPNVAGHAAIFEAMYEGLTAKIKIACIGDSITYGHNPASPSGNPRITENWPKILGDMLGDGYDVRNFGRNGTTLSRNGQISVWNNQEFTDSKNFEPDIVIIKLGTNDYGNTGTYSATLKELIQVYRDLPSEPEVYIATCAMPYEPGAFGIQCGPIINSIVPQQKAVAEEVGCGLIDVHAATADMPENFPDYIHPNVDGHRVIAETVYEALAGAGGCDHEYESVVTEATCTEGGFTTKTCTLCGVELTTSVVPALGHDWDEGVITKAPTNDEDGEKRFTCTRCDETYTKVLLAYGKIDMSDIDFTKPGVEDRYTVDNQTSTAIRDGQGLYLITTTDSFEPCNGQISTFAPKDVVKIPVRNDGYNWSATMKFSFNQASAANGYYQFFGFYAAEGDDYQNMAGIRGGDGAFQNFLRVDGNVTADSADLNSSPGLSTNGTYWWKIEKSGTTYTCYRSADGEAFTEMFRYEDTGIEADSLIIDAYTGMTAGYEFIVESIDFETDGEPMPPPPCEHSYEAVVTDPTCTEGGYTTYTCSKCGDEYVADEKPALGHDWDEGVVTKEPNEIEAGVKTFTCTVCEETKTEAIPAIDKPVCPGAIFSDMPAEDHWAHKGIDYCIENKLMNGTGDGKFSPEGTLTRAQLVTILYRVENEPAVELKGTFSDVPADSWYSKAVEWAEANGIVKGIGGGKFAPEAVITREQIATILYRYEEFKNGAPAVEGDLKAFPDAANVSDFAATAMVWAIENEIITGASVNNVTYLNPLNSATREQIATIIMRYLEAK